VKLTLGISIVAKALILRTKPGKQSASKPVEKSARFVSKKRLEETCPLILENAPDKDYALLDSGNGLKLERYGRISVVRPEAQALWQPELVQKTWDRADAIFTGDTTEEGAGRWNFSNNKLDETWPMAWDGIGYHGRFTSFRHVGVFPEQAAHWRFMEDQIRQKTQSGQEFRLLNLFGYTGLASLVASRAGAHVTHVDASKKAIGWARENQSLAGMDENPIRWICDDAVRFCEREERRGNTYHGILLDPPKYGRGPKGEVWQLFDNLPNMLDLVRVLSGPDSSFVVLTAYSIRASFQSMHEIMQEKFGDMGGRLESGELVLKTENSDRRLSTSLFSRWVSQ
jgi:23S rRNA (cytosine1962-C5)-methyltransferase